MEKGSEKVDAMDIQKLNDYEESDTGSRPFNQLIPVEDESIPNDDEFNDHNDNIEYEDESIPSDDDFNDHNDNIEDEDESFPSDDECNDHNDNLEFEDETIFVSVNRATNVQVTGEEQLDSHLSTISPGGTRWWTPNVDPPVKPVVGDVYDSLDIAYTAYKKYAKMAGFEVRRSSQKRNNHQQIQHKYFVCSKYGYPNKKSFDSLKPRKRQREQRNTNIKRCGCIAYIKVRLVKGSSTKYECYGIVETHNHGLLRKHEMDLSRSARQLKFSDQRFVHDACTSNIGATRAHKLHTSLKGGYDYGGPTAVYYQNYKRDCDNFVGHADAKVLVELMTKKRESDPSFFFAYNCIGSELHTIFWADEVSRFNYSQFGDVISFDSTFRTNRHYMVFVPFTAVNNHNCNVVVGSALVGHEDVPNYKWLLEAFLQAHLKPLMMVLTDQCAAMKQAIAAVFPDARHRLCMWHIMTKVPTKFGSNLLNNTTFKKQFSKLVWNVHISTDEFERRWKLIIEEFSLQKHKWLRGLYKVRSMWIPAYFKELPMCCLMKTTSRSESSNSFFNSFSKSGNNLFMFMLGFEFALDKQRKEQRRLDYWTRSTLPKFKTPTKLEKHACDVYTRSVFYDVQKEIDRAAWTCSIKSVTTVGEVDTYVIDHLDRNEEKITEYKVSRDMKELTTECTCNHFGRHSFLCRHVFKVFLNAGVEAIPDRYICRRWRRDIMPIELQNSRQRICVVYDDRRKLLNETYDVIDDVLDILRDDKEKISSFLEAIKEMRNGYEKERTYEPGLKRKERGIEQMFGFSRPTDVDILPPTGIRNKGCGTSKRMVGGAELAAAKSSKPKRLCRGCNKLANHDIRNCPAKK